MQKIVSLDISTEALNQADNTNWPLDELAKKANLTRKDVKEAMYKGALWIEKARQNKKAKTEKPLSVWQKSEPNADPIILNKAQRIRRIRRQLDAGDRLTLYYDNNVLAFQCPEPRCVDDLGDFSIWDKPPGMLCQGSKWGDHTTLNRWIEVNSEPSREAFIVHRLDKMASGLVIIAHNKKITSLLAAQFEQRLVKKCYQVIVAGAFQNTLPLRVDASIDGKTAVTVIEKQQSVTQAINSGAAVSDWKYEAEKASLLTVSIETGRKHQIRRHMASLGCPVWGDRLYGKAGNDAEKDSNLKEFDLQLRATELSVLHPLNQNRLQWKLL